MIISVKQAFEFQLEQFIMPGSFIKPSSVPNIVVLAKCLVFPGSEQTVPDWVSFNPLFLTALADGDATIVVAPIGTTTINASTISANIELPTTGLSVVVTNTGSDTEFGASPAYVLLGDDESVTVTPATGLAIPPGSSIMLPLDSNSYLAAIGLQADDLLNIAVV